MKESLIMALLVLACLPCGTVAEIKLQDNTTVHLADKKEAAKILGTEDEFIAAMSPFDRSARMQTDREVSKKEFLKFVVLQARSFSNAESERLKVTFASIRKKLSTLNLKLGLPPTITVIKTTGEEEGGAAYCRGRVIVIPQRFLKRPGKLLEDTIIHELFHVLSRTNPQLRRDLYAIVGFLPCGEVPLPQELVHHKITNPDALRNDYYVEVGFEGQRVQVIPILFSSSEKYDVQRGGRFFSYLVFRLMAVKERDGKWVPKLVQGKPLLLEASIVPEYMQKVGRNTQYIIHPEEVLADNFRLMVNQTKNAPTPRIPARMKELLSKQTQPSSPSSSRTEAPKAAETSVSRRRKLRTIAGPAQSAEQPRERSGTGGTSNFVTGGLDSFGYLGQWLQGSNGGDFQFAIPVRSAQPSQNPLHHRSGFQFQPALQTLQQYGVC